MKLRFLRPAPDDARSPAAYLCTLLLEGRKVLYAVGAEDTRDAADEAVLAAMQYPADYGEAEYLRAMPERDVTVMALRPWDTIVFDGALVVPMFPDTCQELVFVLRENGPDYRALVQN